MFRGLFEILGGPGSGHRGHKGRPGKRGGSAKAGSSPFSKKSPLVDGAIREIRMKTKLGERFAVMPVSSFVKGSFAKDLPKEVLSTPVVYGGPAQGIHGTFYVGDYSSFGVKSKTLIMIHSTGNSKTLLHEIGHAVQYSRGGKEALKHDNLIEKFEGFALGGYKKGEVDVLKFSDEAVSVILDDMRDKSEVVHFD